MKMPCRFQTCECLHVGCEDGWYTLTGSDGSDYVRPCRTCRPEVSAHLLMAPGSGAQVRAQLRHLPRPSRVSSEAGKAKKTHR